MKKILENLLGQQELDIEVKIPSLDKI